MSDSEPKVVRTFLTMLENHQLADLLIKEYTSSGLNDCDFAVYASTKMNLREGVVLKDHTIKQRRDAFKIPNNYKFAPMKAGPADQAMLLAHELQIKEQEERLNKLETWINANFPTKGLKKAV